MSRSGRVSEPPIVSRPDRRVQRTQRALREALIKLIRERGWDNVSVMDVCERANVGRSTFYVHFADKEELLVSGFGDLRQAMRAHLAPDNAEPLGYTVALIEHAREYKELFRALIGRRTAAKVQQGFMRVVKELVSEDLVRAGVPVGQVPELVVSYVAGAFWETVWWWLEQRNPPPARELAATFRRMTVPVLRVVQLQFADSGH